MISPVFRLSLAYCSIAAIILSAEVIKAEESSTPLLGALRKTTISGYADLRYHWHPGVGQRLPLGNQAFLRSLKPDRGLSEGIHYLPTYLKNPFYWKIWSKQFPTPSPRHLHVPPLGSVVYQPIELQPITMTPITLEPSVGSSNWVYTPLQPLQVTTPPQWEQQPILGGLQPVPEPGTWAILGIGAVASVCVARRRSRQPTSWEN